MQGRGVWPWFGVHRDTGAMAVALPSTMAFTGTVYELAFGKTWNEPPSVGCRAI